MRCSTTRTKRICLLLFSPTTIYDILPSNPGATLPPSSLSAVQKARTEQQQNTDIIRTTGKVKRNNDIITNIA
jgi:hypothetical protein